MRCAALLLLLHLIGQCCAAHALDDPRPPNVVLIVSDDAGYADFSMHGSSEMATPHIDSIARDGVRFAQAYVSASVCSPSRAGMLTGRYQQRFGHELNIPARYSDTNGLPLSERTIANFLQDAGYRTIALGKWHLGYADHFHPLSRGFDDYYGFLQGARSFWPIEGTQLNRLLRDREPIPESFTYMTDELGEQAARYIQKHRDRPFFMYLCFNAVHTPMHATDDDLAAYEHISPGKRRKLAAMTRAMDRAVGRVLGALAEHGVASDTIVIFINDNGGATNNASTNTPLRGTKGTPFEGGLRVPMVMRWPAGLPAGTVYEQPVISLDILPTALAAAGIEATPPHRIDGVDLLPYLRGESTERPHETLFWRRRGNFAVRSGDHKLVRPNGEAPMLFDLAADPSEQVDLAGQQPERLRQILEKYEAWSAELVDPLWRYRNERKKKTEPAPAATPPAAPTRPNVLWIIGEDLGPELACYGTPQVRTPHLDALARDGVRYTHAFMTAPVCSTSRSAIFTGMYQTTIGAHNHRSHRDDGYRLPDGVRHASELFRDGGYFVANIREVPGTSAEMPSVRGTGKTDWNFTVDGPAFDSDRWSDLQANQPFFAQINFAETHRGKAWDTAHERIERPADPARVEIPACYPDHPLVRADWAQYLNTVMALDRKVGVVLDRLEADGLHDNTIVFFFSDHGRAMVRGKQWCYDGGLHVPLIIRRPDHLAEPADATAGTVDDRLVAGIDLLPTSLALAGLERPATMQGRPFLGKSAEARSRVFGARDRCDETVFRIRTVRTKRYRYIRNFMPERPFLQLNRYKESTYPVIGLLRDLAARGELEEPAATLLAPQRPAEELYDLTRDPDEVENLADDPSHADTLATLRDALDAWIVESDDQGRTPEPAAVVEAWDQRMARTYDGRY